MLRENWFREIFQEAPAKSYFNTITISCQLWTFDASAHPCWCYLSFLRNISSAFLLFPLLFPPCVFLPFSPFSSLILILLPFPLFPHLPFSVPPLSPSSPTRDYPGEWGEPSSTRPCPFHTSTSWALITVSIGNSSEQGDWGAPPGQQSAGGRCAEIRDKGESEKVKNSRAREDAGVITFLLSQKHRAVPKKLCSGDWLPDSWFP